MTSMWNTFNGLPSSGPGVRARTRPGRNAPAAAGAPASRPVGSWTRPLGACLALALAAPACPDAPAEAGWSVTVDTLSNGVVHVVNRPPAGGIAPTWIIEPELTIGSLEGTGPSTFGEVKGVAPLENGRIAVLESQAQEIRIFAPDGRHLRTLGGRGGGPGELQRANGILAGPDGLLRVNDPQNARLSLFHPDSGFVASGRLEVTAWGFRWGAVIDSANRVHELTLAAIGDEYWRLIKVYDARGRWTDTVRLRPMDPMADDPPGVYRYERGATTVPFWPRAARALDPGGHFWFKGANANDYRIARTTFEGDTLLLFESARRPLPVSAAERDSAIAVLREVAGRELDWSQIPAEKPIVQALHLDDRGRVWVRVAAADALVTFDVFKSDGRYEGTAIADLRIPSWEPVIRGDVVYTVVTDELDVPYVVRARIRPARSGTEGGG